jgi:hypothetical protein
MTIEPAPKTYYAVAEITTDIIVRTTKSMWLAAEALVTGTCWAKGTTAKSAKKAARREAARFREVLHIDLVVQPPPAHQKAIQKIRDLFEKQPTTTEAACDASLPQPTD